MKFDEAMDIIKGSSNKSGFMVHFERVEGSMLVSDYFPEKHQGEKLIETEDEAWRLARKFAQKTTGRYVNIYVIDEHFYPVKEYKNKEITNR